MSRGTLRGIWRLLQPWRYTHGLKRFRLPGQYVWFMREWSRFKAAGGTAPLESISPVLFDRDPSTQSGGGHYFFQDVWALRKLSELKPAEHHDVGSRLDGFVGQATAVCPITFWDIRPPSFKLDRFTYRQGSVLALPVADASIPSLSCLHTAEHIGLGRYGDPVDPEGTPKCLAELQRVIAPGGHLLFSMPVGVDRVEFNAQRIWPPERPIKQLSQLQLKEFSGVDDAGSFHQNIPPEQLAGERYACGMYHFTRPG